MKSRNFEASGYKRDGTGIEAAGGNIFQFKYCSSYLCFLFQGPYIPKVFDLLPKRDYGKNTTIEKRDEFKYNSQNIEHGEEVRLTKNIQRGDLTKGLPKWSSIQGVMLKSSMVVREVGSGAVQVSMKGL
ncbi:hypothetical protein GQ457_10G016780 [Hibiscus cannabinus]